jgi:phage shock protein A
VSLFRRRRDEPVVPAAPTYDPTAGERAYQRLLTLAAELRASSAGLSAAAARIEMRERQLRKSAEEYDRLAQQAVAAGRTIQAESAIASAETAAAALDAIAPQAAEIAEQRAALEQAATRIDGDAAALRARLDAAATSAAVSGARAALQETGHALAGHRGTVDDVVREAEDHAMRLEARARALAELHEPREPA